MNKPITILIFAFCCLLSNATLGAATDSSNIHFENALQEVKEMLEGTKKLDFERAVFITENAYHDNAYSYEAFQQTIANNLFLITQLIYANNKSDTLDFNVKVQQNGRFNIDEIRYTPQQKKELYNNELANWAIFTYITDTTAFGSYTHYPYQYNAKDPFGMKDWKNSQVINLLASNENTGNCFAFAALFKIFANQLNSNAVICTAPQHIYIQHQDHKGDWYNVELATAGHPTDGSIQTLTYTTNKALMNDIALRNLDEKQSVALCLVNLAKSYEHKYNNPTADFLLQCAALALQHDPKNLNALLLKQQVLDAKVVAYARTNKINTIEKLRNDKEINGQLTQLEKHLAHLSNLGYIQMPVDMQEIVLNGFKGEHTAQFIKKDKNPSPFTSIAVPEKENHYVDVSHGLFQEVFAPKAIEIYGHFTFNTQQGKLTQLDTTTINHQLIDPVAFAYDFGARMYDARLGRFLSVDPMFSDFATLSPYQYASNTPIMAIDLGGLMAWIATRQWDATHVEKFQSFIKKETARLIALATNAHKEKKGRSTEYCMDCADYAVVLLIRFAKENELEIEFTDTKGNKINSSDDQFDDIDAFETYIRANTNAESLQNDMTLVSVNELQAGDVSNSGGNTVGQSDHINVFLEVNQEQKKFTSFSGTTQGGEDAFLFIDRKRVGDPLDSKNFTSNTVPFLRRWNIIIKAMQNIPAPEPIPPVDQSLEGAPDNAATPDEPN